ncbi:hypothetical protein F503_03459 [Ophiostoma piceae UAMH 11346]|uniref:Secreted protein n=1 Tax=Ophiostoma piceae (strain UAMH 11346) TaxID=1262450 RepID=S3C2M6_OPHP1|nr:hypothetical protein F503_03459 [Ophiostoma piceae UAMH 11346]
MTLACSPMLWAAQQIIGLTILPCCRLLAADWRGPSLAAGTGTFAELHYALARCQLVCAGFKGNSAMPAQITAGRSPKPGRQAHSKELGSSSGVWGITQQLWGP